MRIVKLLLFLVSLLLVRVDVYAYDFKVNGLCYNKLSDSTVELTWEDVDRPYTGDVVVPDHVDYSGKRYDVVTIGDEAFVWFRKINERWLKSYSNNKLSSVLLPTTITSIGYMAFGGCSGLTSIKIPSSVTSIGVWAFSDCSGLTSINVENGNPSYDSRNDCNAIIETSTNSLMLGCKNTTIPSSVNSIRGFAFLGCSGLTSLTIPSSVTSIEESAFRGCSGLTSINVENGNPSYDSRNDCNAIIETSTNTLISGCKNTTIPNSVTSIKGSAFAYCSGLTSITIPNSVTSIGYMAFGGCSGLTSLTIPNSVTSIGEYAFAYCTSLTSVISEIINPFEIGLQVFFDIGTNATLTVPSGTKSKYQATNYWNKFPNIVEAGGSPTATEVTFTSNQITYRGTVSSKTTEVKSVNNGVVNLEIPSSVSYNGTTYQVTSIADGVLSGRTFNYVSLPSTVKSISSSTFDNSKLGALIWNANASLSQSVFSNMAMPVSSNFLLYVNSASYAPSNVKNVVVDGIAQTIVLSDDGGNFYCPEGFTAQSISYTHNYSMTTGGNGKGWEALALPFDVKNIEHKTKGTLTPFALYDSSNSSQRPFWLYELGSSGFRRSSGIKANTPYIIAMPNNTSYDSDYILTGDVTFSASNAKVYETSSVVTAVSGSKRFVPAFSAVEKSSSVYALNVSNQKVSYSGSYDKGSHFISNLRSTYPFEAYMTTSSNGTRTRSIGIEFDDDVTAIDIVPATGGETDIVKVYSMNGILVLQTDHKSLQKRWESLPAGVYIVNGKKVLK